MEASLKLARQYFVEIGQPQRHAFIARRQSYHGNTLGALAIGGNAWRCKPFLPILVPAHHVSPCYAYRGLEPGEDEASYSRRLALELEAKIIEIGPDKVAAFVAETVVGATLGAVPPTAGYFREIRGVCDKYGVLLILDEVMSGMGRTGHLFACTEDEVIPDIVVIAKGLGAGYQPIGAMMVYRRIYDAILAGTGFFQHGHTYLGHAIACAAALEVQKVIAEEDLLPKVRRLGERLQDRLQARLGQHPHVGNIRGRGLFRGIELVADRESKEPLDPSLRTHAKLKAEAMRRGLLTYPMGGTVDGVRATMCCWPHPSSAPKPRSMRSSGALAKRSMPSSPGIDRIVLAVAPNGARKTRQDHPALPITPQELAHCAAACRDAGASMLHLHVRNAEGGHSLAPMDYRPAVDAVRRAVGLSLVLQLTSEAVGIYAPAEQQAMVRELRPEAVSLALREILPDVASEPAGAGFLVWACREEYRGPIHSTMSSMWNAMASCAGAGSFPKGGIGCFSCWGATRPGNAPASPISFPCSPPGVP